MFWLIHSHHFMPGKTFTSKVFVLLPCKFYHRFKKRRLSQKKIFFCREFYAFNHGHAVHCRPAWILNLAQLIQLYKFRKCTRVQYWCFLLSGHASLTVISQATICLAGSTIMSIGRCIPFSAKRNNRIWRVHLTRKEHFFLPQRPEFVSYVLGVCLYMIYVLRCR